VPRDLRLRRACVGALVLLVAGLASVVLARAQRLPGGVEPVAWDRAACAHCRMLIGEPSFAAQLQLRDGRVLDFDDPGCLLRQLAEEHAGVHAVWFHHAHEDRWLRADQVGFERGAASPMGWGLAAVGLDEPHDLDLAAATALIAAAKEPSP
jgi:copper chaperone NosL